MEYRKFGKLDWQVSEIGFGAWAIGGGWGSQDDNDSIEALSKAIDNGVNFIDTAQGYGNGHSEEVIGKVLQDRTEEIFIATKVPPTPGFQWPPPYDADINVAFPVDYIVRELEKSLKRLKRDHVDIYQFHTWAPKFNVEDEWFEVMSKLKKEGKIRAIGVSVPDTTPDSIIGSLIKEKVDSIQVIYNIFEQYPEWNLFPVCEKQNVAVIVRVPFDEGALTGKFSEDTLFEDGDVRKHYFRGSNLKATIEKVDEIDRYRKENSPENTMANFALKFCLSNPNVSTVIPGIRNIDQANKNTSASDGKYLNERMIKELESFAWKKDFWFEEVSHEK